MYKTKERFFIIPKKEWYNINMEIDCIQDFLKKFDDYEIKECTEEKINNMIANYNMEQDIKYFDRLKAQDFYFVRTTEIEIGKYKSGKIEILYLWKK